MHKMPRQLLIFYKISYLITKDDNIIKYLVWITRTPGSAKHYGWKHGSYGPTNSGVSIFINQFIYLFIYLSFRQSVYLSIFLSIYLSFFPSIYLSIHLSIFLSIYLSFYPSIYLSIPLSIFLPIYLSNHLHSFIQYIKFNTKDHNLIPQKIIIKENYKDNIIKLTFF